MSYRRRACYVCGQLGHLAQDCSSSERLCFNCGKGGHESSACPEPRSVEIKQCFNCQGKGHIASNCPTPRVRAPPVPRATSVGVVAPAVAGGVAGQGCFVCGGPHLKKQCPSLSNSRLPGGVTPAPALLCHRCGGPNHFARDCKAPLAPGAIGTPVASGSSRPPKRCHRCAQVGHLVKDCPEPDPNAAGNAPDVVSPGVGAQGAEALVA